MGTFGAMYLLGYSLDNLSLMALTISTGFVVDDAIVMIENISRYIEEGYPPLEAALRGAEQIGFTIVSLTVSLTAVLIPLLFMGDIIGRLVPRICRHAGRDDFRVRVRFADADADDVREAFASHRGGQAKPLLSSFGTTSSSERSNCTEKACKFVLRHQTATLLVTAGTLVLTLVLLLLRAEGFFPGAGYGRDSRDFGCSARPSRFRRWRNASRRSPR